MKVSNDGQKVRDVMTYVLKEITKTKNTMTTNSCREWQTGIITQQETI